MRQLFKKVMVCFLAIQLAFFTPFANANTSPSGWAFSGYDAVAGIVSAVKNGTKATATVVKSPIVSKVGKGILGGVIAGAAIPLAISQISGIALDAVDWLLDPANNAIKYRQKGGDTIAKIKVTGGSNAVVSTPEQACQKYMGETATCSNINVVDGRVTACATWQGQSTPYCTTVGYYEDVPNGWQSVPIPTVSDKIYDNAKTGHADSVSAVTTAVADLTKEGEYDTPLDLSKPEDKTCEAGYVKNSAGECVKKDEPKTCPAGSVKVGDICIEPPKPDDDGSCGECCDQLLQAISALAKLQTELNQTLLDSDAETREEIKKIQDKIDLLSTDLKNINDNIVKLVDEAKKLNTTVEKLDENQELRFKNLTDTINQAKKELLDSDKITKWLII